MWNPCRCDARILLMPLAPSLASDRCPFPAAGSTGEIPRRVRTVDGWSGGCRFLQSATSQMRASSPVEHDASTGWMI